MTPDRFHRIVPEAAPDDLRVVCPPVRRSGISRPWEVRYGDRTVTSGDVFTCTRWVHLFRRLFT
jgi:hypothetical protein